MGCVWAIPRHPTRGAKFLPKRLRVHPVDPYLPRAWRRAYGDPRAWVLEAALRMKRIGTPVPRVAKL